VEPFTTELSVNESCTNARQPAIEKCPQLKLVAVYSRSHKSAQSLEAVGAAVYSEDSGPGKTYEDLLESKDIVAVIIAYVRFPSRRGERVAEM
jgi:predicted dehydrogenase